MEDWSEGVFLTMLESASGALAVPGTRQLMILILAVLAVSRIRAEDANWEISVEVKDQSGALLPGSELPRRA